MAHHCDPVADSFAEPRSRPQPSLATTRQAPWASILTNSNGVPSKRSANPNGPVPSPSLAGLQRADRQEQERLMKAHRAEQHRLWVAQHEEQLNTVKYPKRALHLLVVEALRYHRERRTSELNRKLAASIALKHPGGAPPTLQVDPAGFSLSNGVVQQIFDDVDWLVDHYGREMGLRALEQMFLWDTTARSTSSSRTAPRRRVQPPAS